MAGRRRRASDQLRDGPVAGDALKPEEACLPTVAGGHRSRRRAPAERLLPDCPVHDRSLRLLLWSRSDARVAHDKPLTVERDVADEVAGAETDYTIAQGLIALL